MRDDDTTEVAPRQSPSTTTSVRLFNGLGGVELGVRHTGRKAMLFVRFRKLVIAGWWKAPGAPGRTPVDLAVERAEDRRAAAGVPNARPAVQSGNDAEAASLTTSASVTRAAGVTTGSGPAMTGATKTGPAGAAKTGPAKTGPTGPAMTGAAKVAGAARPEASPAPPEVQNPMQRLWARFSSSFKRAR